MIDIIHIHISFSRDGDMLLTTNDPLGLKAEAKSYRARFCESFSGDDVRLQDDITLSIFVEGQYTMLPIGDGRRVLVSDDDDCWREPRSLPTRTWLMHHRSLSDLFMFGSTTLRMFPPRLCLHLSHMRSAKVQSIADRLLGEAMIGAAQKAAGSVAASILDACEHDADSDEAREALQEAARDAFTLAMMSATPQHARYGAALHLLALSIERDDAVHGERAMQAIESAVKLDREPGPRAFVVEDSGAYKWLFFARDEAHAVRLAVEDLDLEEGDVAACVPMPKWDIYAEKGDAPADEWLREGYDCECAHCGHVVGRRGCKQGCVPADDNGKPTIRYGTAYCSEACADASDHDTDASAAENVEAEEAACVVLLARHPKAEVTGVDAIFEKHKGRRWMGKATFRFRGQRGHDAVWREDGRVLVNPIDAAAWRAFAGLPDDPGFPRRCRHGTDAWDCNVLCARCSHACWRHGAVGDGPCRADECHCMAHDGTS